MNMALAGLAVLIIGDSHIAATGFFNDPLHDALVDRGAVVDSFGVCGSSAANWVTPAPIVCGRGERLNRDTAAIQNSRELHGWALPELIDKYKPDLVVIDLGDTMAGYGVTPELPRVLITDEVRELLVPLKAQNLPCAWVGPPWGTEGGPYQKTYTRVKELSDLLSHIVAPCHYIDSLAFSRPGQWPTLDGVHLTSASNQQWDNDVVRSLVQIAAGLHRR